MLLAGDGEDLTALLQGSEGIETDTIFENERFAAGDAVVEGACPAAFESTSGGTTSSSLRVAEVSVENLREMWPFAFRTNAARAEAGRKALSKVG